MQNNQIFILGILVTISIYKKKVLRTIKKIIVNIIGKNICKNNIFPYSMSILTENQVEKLFSFSIWFSHWIFHLIINKLEILLF